MCGLVGVVGLNGAPVDPQVVESMARVLRHRGPDDQGSFVERSIGLGFRRLSILDLSPAGHQPMASPDGNLVMVFNGEIYNYVELRAELESLGHHFQSSGDSEVLLHAYMEWGRDCLERLNGMWAFLIYDRRRQVLFGSRDRFGKKPLYYHRTKDHVYFGSEIKALRASGCYSGGPNWTAASAFLMREGFDSSQTFFAGILPVPEGTAFELDADGAWKQWRYWCLPDADSAVEPDPAGAFRDTFDDAVRLRLRSDVPVGILLSGGLDSTSVAFAIARLREAAGGTGPLLAFTYQAKEFDESAYIDETVRRTGLELVPFHPDPKRLLETFEQVLWHQDEPVHSINTVITFELSRLASRRGVKVLLNGGGPDEYLAGYPNFLHDHWHALVMEGRLIDAWREVSTYHGAHGGSAPSAFTGLLAGGVKARVRGLPLAGTLIRQRQRSALRRHAWFTPELTSQLPADLWMGANGSLHAALKRAMELAPLPLYLRIEDRNSMAHSIEARMPFLDYRLVSLAFRLPAHWKLRGPWTKFILRESMRGRIPEMARTRLDKMGFPVPTRSWFAGELYEPMQDLLGSREARERGIYNLDVVRRDLERHRAGQVDVSGPLWRLFQFETWSKLEGRGWTASNG